MRGSEARDDYGCRRGALLLGNAHCSEAREATMHMAQRRERTMHCSEARDNYAWLRGA